jgi:hypothetical protein
MATLSDERMRLFPTTELPTRTPMQRTANSSATRACRAGGR